MECKACPLAILNNKHPNMAPTGAAKPLVYALGEAPGKNEDEQNEQFIGASGQLLRERIPKQYQHLVRFNNVVRTRPFQNETPSPRAMEACRPSIIRDIEQSQPRAIFGFGDVPLRWTTGLSGITHWRGRRMPVRMGEHTCWYYAMLHPAFLLYEGKRGNEEAKRMFVLDLKRAFRELENLPEPDVHGPEDARRGLTLLTEPNLDKVRQALFWAATQKDLGVDYETVGKRPYAQDARILSVAVDNGEEGYAIPFDHPEAAWSERKRAELDRLWVEFLRHAQGRLWVHNLAFEHEWTAVKYGPDLLRAANWQDTASQAVVLDERVGQQKPGCLSLEFLVQQHFGFNIKKVSSLNRKELANEPMELVLLYNGGDARYHCLLGKLQDKLIKRDGLEEVYRLSNRKVPTVVLTQVKGVPVSQPAVQELQAKYEERLIEIDGKISKVPVVKEFGKLQGETFKPMSTQHVLKVFKDMLKHPDCMIYDKKTGKERYSVDESVLERIDHPLANMLIKRRKVARQLSTYIYPLLKGHESSVLWDDGLLHATFNTLFAETSRLSCEDPNLQNFPKRDGEAKEVRRSVQALSGHVMLAVDYGQIEARVLAMLTLDKLFVKALWENYDVHMEWAERLAHAYPARIGGRKNLTDKKVMKDFRTDIKNQWTFPLFFGAQRESAAGYLSIPVDVLRPHYREFWKQFSGVKKWQEGLLEFYRSNGYVECLTGRRRRGPLTVNQIINSPVQGTAAEIVLDCMSRLSETGDPELQPEINIHDDLTFCWVPVERVDDIAEKVIDTMLKVPFEWAHVVPISVEASVGDNWMDLEEIGTFSSDKWR